VHFLRSPRAASLLTPLLALGLAACGSSSPGTGSTGAQAKPPARRATVPSGPRTLGPPLIDPHNVYAADRAGNLAPAVRHVPQRVYVPNSESNSVSVINPKTYRVTNTFGVGELPQHVVPSYDLKTLWVTNDQSNSLTPIDPKTGRPGKPVAVEDPYNLYFTPDGRFAIAVAERLHRLDFLEPRTMKLRHALNVPCKGVDHLDFTADGRFLLASCEFGGGGMVEVDVARQKVVRTVDLGGMAMPQDVKLSPDGRVFYVADMKAGGVWVIDAHTFKKTGFIKTGAGAHGLYPSRDSRDLYVSNRSAGSVSVISFASRKVVSTWQIPGGSPDMGGVSADGRVLWLSGRYNAEVYAIDTRSGHLLARIPVQSGPHGLCIFPQPGRFSLGHTGIFR
jgi:YVTN family beta-propeller protein